MERLLRTSRLWSWLPTFRVVAETEHLREAANRLHISPSAISRTIGLIEEDLGRSLFHRVGRGLLLTEEGSRLLEATRRSMRTVHDALERMGNPLEGPLRIATTGTIASGLLAPLLPELYESHPAIVPRLLPLELEQVGTLLLRGDIDIALATRPIKGDAIQIRRLTDSTNGVYCGRAHPLWKRTHVELSELLEHPFVAPPPDELGVPVEGWPAEIERTVAVEVSSFHVGLQLCASGRYLAVLHDDVAAPSVALEALHRVEMEDVVPPTPIYAMTRASVSDHRSRVDVLLEMLTNAVRAHLSPSD